MLYMNILLKCTIKKTMCLFFSCLLIVLTVAFISPIFVSAGDYSHTSSTAKELGHTTFKSAWKDYGTFKIDGNYYDFTYGYDTVGTDEDYIKKVYAQKDYGTTYYGRVKNSDAVTDVTSVKSGTSKTGKADVVHARTSVRYSVYARY